jgi:hypothetical protein
MQFVRDLPVCHTLGDEVENSTLLIAEPTEAFVFLWRVPQSRHDPPNQRRVEQ